MKNWIILLMIFCWTQVQAQGGNKKYKVKLDNYLVYYKTIVNPGYQDDPETIRAIQTLSLLTPQQQKNALKLAQLSSFPEALNSLDEIKSPVLATVKDYNAYWMGRWTEFFPASSYSRQLQLIWVPKDENLHMPAEYQPKTAEGFFVITKVDGLEVENPVVPDKIATASLAVKLRSRFTVPAAKNFDFEVFFKSLVSPGVFYKSLSKEAGLTAAEIQVVCDQSKMNGYPAGISGNMEDIMATMFGLNNKRGNFEKISQYKFFKVASGDLYGNGVSLYWVPGNQSFTEDMKPLNSLGYFFSLKDDPEKDIVYPKNGIENVGSAYWMQEISDDAYQPSRFVWTALPQKEDVAAAPKPNDPPVPEKKTDPVVVTIPKVPQVIPTVSYLPNEDISKPNEGSVQHRQRKKIYLTGFDIWSFTDFKRETNVVKTLKEKYGYSDDDCRVIERLSHIDHFPSGIREYRNLELNDNFARGFTCYQIAEVTTGFASYAVLWLPYEENKDLPVGIRPETRDGFYVFAYPRALSNTKLGHSQYAVKSYRDPSPVVTRTTPPTDQATELQNAKERTKSLEELETLLKWLTENDKIYERDILACVPGLTITMKNCSETHKYNSAIVFRVERVITNGKKYWPANLLTKIMDRYYTAKEVVEKMYRKN